MLGSMLAILTPNEYASRVRHVLHLRRIGGRPRSLGQIRYG
jgi:hypothetical protein